MGLSFWSWRVGKAHNLVAFSRTQFWERWLLGQCWLIGQLSTSSPMSFFMYFPIMLPGKSFCSIWRCPGGVSFFQFWLQSMTLLTSKNLLMGSTNHVIFLQNISIEILLQTLTNRLTYFPLNLCARKEVPFNLPQMPTKAIHLNLLRRPPDETVTSVWEWRWETRFLVGGSGWWRGEYTRGYPKSFCPT